MDPMLFDLMFGYGPRQCIGMRLALVEIKYAVVYLLRRFRFVRCSDTPVSLPYLLLLTLFCYYIVLLLIGLVL